MEGRSRLSLCYFSHFLPPPLGLPWPVSLVGIISRFLRFGAYANPPWALLTVRQVGRALIPYNQVPCVAHLCIY